MFDFDGFGSINALAAADTLDALNPLLKFSAIDDSGAGLNIVLLIDNALGRTLCAASNLFFNSSPCSIKNLAAFTALFADDTSVAAANIPPASLYSHVGGVYDYASNVQNVNVSVSLFFYFYVHVHAHAHVALS